MKKKNLDHMFIERFAIIRNAISKLYGN